MACPNAWTPADLPDATTMTPAECFRDLAGTIPCVPGDPVALWKNAVIVYGVPHDAVQPSPTKRPTYVGNGVVRFDGVDDCMTHAGSLFDPPADTPHVVTAGPPDAA